MALKKFKIVWLDKNGLSANLGLDEVVEAEDEGTVREMAEYYFFLDRGVLPEETDFHLEVTPIKD